MGFWKTLLFGTMFDKPKPPPPAKAPERTIYWLLGDDSYDFEIVGESKYQEALERIAGPKCEEGCEEEFIAILKPEPANLVDPNAVQVVVNDMVVGYIPRVPAAGLAALFRELQIPPSRAQVFGKIVGGWSRPGSEGSFGVKLDLSWPPRVVKPQAGVTA